MVTAYYFITLIYSLFIIRVQNQLSRFHTADKQNEDDNQKISVLIPFRNEEKKLGTLLRSLRNQNLSPWKFEVILIDDHSTDKGFDLCSDYIVNNELSNFHVIRSGSKCQSKKNAIYEGLKKTRYDWILQTDADCTHHPGWLESFMNMTNKANHFITGPVLIKGNGFMGHFFEIESWALIAITALGIHRRNPQMSNAGNMLWNKKELEQKEFEKLYSSDILSGDDQFLMNAFAKNKPDALAYNWSKQALVETYGPESIGGFISQRLRWASKWKNSETKAQWLFPALIWAYHLFHTIGTIALFLIPGWMFVLPAILIKGLSEYVLLKWTASRFDHRLPILPFLFMQVIYSPYVVLFGLLSQFANQKWK